MNPVPLLPTLRGGAPRRQPNVRVLAAYAEHADCNLASLGFAARVDYDRLLAGTSYEAQFGQSPFAFSRGRRFEESLRENGYGRMLQLLRENLGFKVEEAQIVNLRDGYPPNRVGMLMRARRTQEFLDQMLRDDPHAPNLIDGAVFSTALGGIPAFFEADSVAARSTGPIRVGEIKSFPVVDGRADPEKVAGALDQIATYILLGRQVALDLHRDPAGILSESMLITPRNVGLRPAMTRQDVANRVARMERLLSRVPSIADLAAVVPAAASFGLVADQRTRQERQAGMPDPHEDQRLDVLHTLADRVGTTFKPSCLASCGLGRFCRSRQFEAASPALAGSKVVRLLPNVHTLGRATELAQGAPAGPVEAPAAAQLRRAARLYDQYGMPLVVGGQRP